MKTTITNEIVKFIVHNLISQSYPGNLNYTDDSDEEYNRGWNEALKNYQDNLIQQTKNKAPELTDTIVNMIVEEIEIMIKENTKGNPFPTIEESVARQIIKRLTNQ